ncbi:MAG: hypothetical protein EBU49_15270, partial [Proteobacteria bacterium]|nr:hypothetical protein [Pseudomonadota bacterium]
AGIFMASTSLSATGYTLNWEAATDNVTAQGSLQYLVCMAKAFEDIDTIAECEGSSRQVRAYSTSTSFATTASGPLNYFNVVVRDGDGNKSLYNGKAQRQYAPSLPVGFNNTVSAIALGSDGTQYVGGTFGSAGYTTGGFAPISSSSTGNLTITNSELNSVVGTVSASAPDGNGGVYLGGTFTYVGGVARNNLAHIDRYGNVDLLWNPNPNSYVYALAVSGSTVYVGGYFTFMAGVSRNYLAAVDATTGALSPWNPNANDLINTLIVSGSTVYVGGRFGTIGGVTRGKLAAIGTDGTLLPWNPTANNYVHALAISGSTVYVGGQFSTIGGTTRNNLASVDATSGALSSWN